MNLGLLPSLVIVLFGNFLASLGAVMQKYSVTGLTDKGTNKLNGGKLKIIWILVRGSFGPYRFSKVVQH